MSRRYKDRSMQRIYDAYRGGWSGGVFILPSGQPRGDGWSVAYWRGWNGIRRADGGVPQVPMSQGWAAYMAGADDRREQGRTDRTLHWSAKR